VFLLVSSIRQQLGKVHRVIHSHIDRTFLMEVFLLSAAQKFVRTCIMNNFSRNLARILAPQEE
jgi:hypothetical protein